MQYPIIASILLASVLQAGCSEDFNWREASLPPTPLRGLFPCKPERAQRNVTLAGASLDLHMASCSTAGVTTAIGHARLPSSDMSGAVLGQWRQATLQTMAARDVVEHPLALIGVRVDTGALQLQAFGKGPDGKPLTLRAAWFAQGSTAFVAMVYGEQLGADVTETFFSGLRLP